MIEPGGNIVENSSRNMITKPIRNQMIPQREAKGGEDSPIGRGKDLDKELTAQNFMKVARKGDL